MIDAALKRKIARLSDEELKQLQIASSLRIDGLNGLTERVLAVASELFTEDGIASGGRACPSEFQDEILDIVRKRLPRFAARVESEREVAAASGVPPDALNPGGSVATGEAEGAVHGQG